MFEMYNFLVNSVLNILLQLKTVTKKILIDVELIVDVRNLQLLANNVLRVVEWVALIRFLFGVCHY